MSSQELNIDCPCCRAKLVVDPETGAILKATPHKEEAPSLQEFLKSDKNRAQDLADKFAESKRQEDSRLKILEKKFEWAKKNKDKLPEAPRPGIQWD
jgi:hypothetical protein